MVDMRPSAIGIICLDCAVATLRYIERQQFLYRKFVFHYQNIRSHYFLRCLHDKQLAMV